MTTLDAPPVLSLSPTVTPLETRPPRGRIDVLGPALPRSEEVLTPEALDLLTDLHDRFASRRAELLAERARRRTTVGNGRDLRFRPETAAVRADPDWRVAGAGPGLADRRVEYIASAFAAAVAASLGFGALT